jgi:hypothetical protein
MSTAEILAQLHRLTPEERESIRERLDAIDESAPLSAEEKRLVDDRVAAYRRDPGAAKTWAVAEGEIRKHLGL